LQVDYTLSGYVFEGIPVPAAVLHIDRVIFDFSGTAIVQGRIFPSLAVMQANGAAASFQWSYPVADAQPLAQIWAGLGAMTGLIDSTGSPVSLVGAVPVPGE
jgi:hypothetical protein